MTRAASRSARASPHLARRAATTYLAYVAAGFAGLLLSVGPGYYATPFFPAAGVALVAALLWRQPALWAVAAASATINGFSGATPAGTAPLLMLASSLGIGIAAALQAAVGMLLIRRALPQPTAPGTNPRWLLRFYLLGAASCIVNCTLSVPLLLWLGLVDAAVAWQTWWTWFSGDVLGLLVGAPIMLMLSERESSGRRALPDSLMAGLPLLVAALLCGAGVRHIAQTVQEQRQRDLTRDATQVATTLGAQWRDAEDALVAAATLAAFAEAPGQDDFRRIAAHWLGRDNGLRALLWLAPAADAPAAAPGEPAPPLIERLAEPRSAARGASPDAAALDAIERSRRSGRAVALREPGEPGRLMIYLAVAAPIDRPGSARGAMVAAWQPADLSLGLAGGSATLESCLIEVGGVGDVGTRAAPAAADAMEAAAAAEAAPAPAATAVQAADALRLLGERCPSSIDAGFVSQPLQFGGRHWIVRSAPRSARLPAMLPSWLLSLSGMLAVSLIGAVLLLISSRSRRVEQEVEERDSALRLEASEHQRTSHALHASERQLRNVLDTVPTCVLTADLDGRIVETNPKLRELLGFSADEMAQMSASELLHPEDRAADAELSAALARGEIPLARQQKRLLTRDGRTVWVSSAMTALRDDHGRAYRLVCVAEDITEHLQLQEAQRARDNAEAANRAKSEFVSRMSHELRTPLNAMLGFAQLLELDKQKPLAAHQLEWTAQIQHAGWHLLHMINDTLDLSRIEAGTLKLQIDALDLAELLRATRALLEHRAQRRNVVVREDIDPRAAAVRGDLTRVKEILTNLLSNAIKYNREGGSVLIRSRPHGDDDVQIEVIDTGLGMTEEQLAQLFQPFNRLGRENSAEEGTGIGLVISRRLAELMNGSLRARSVAGEGSAFVLQLPSASLAQAQRPLVEAGEAIEEPTYRRRVVHYIEDNETNAEVMRGILAQRPQIRLLVSANGLDGLAAVRARAPSLILLDMHLPDVDGIELLRHLKADPQTADIPIVAVSADATATRVAAAMAAGAARYLTKPVSVAQILAVLDEHLEPLETRFG